jgi:hypothetical protein
MERFLAHRGYLIACVLIAVLLTWLWSQREVRFARLQPGHVAQGEIEVPPSFAWMQKDMGELGTHAPAVREIAFEGADVVGMELLNSTSPLAVAAQTELARWSSPGRLPLETQKVRVTEVDDLPALLLEIEARGPEIEVLAWLDHLLHAPIGAGYLTDPAFVHLTADGDALQLRLGVRVWPAAAFMRHSIAAEVQG